ncbi:hypothetical protein quinque_013989 [Culex quinquefasciatus]
MKQKVFESDASGTSAERCYAGWQLTVHPASDEMVQHFKTWPNRLSSGPGSNWNSSSGSNTYRSAGRGTTLAARTTSLCLEGTVHPRLSEPSVPTHHNKESLLDFRQNIRPHFILRAARSAELDLESTTAGAQVERPVDSAVTAHVAHPAQSLHFMSANHKKNLDSNQYCKLLVWQAAEFGRQRNGVAFSRLTICVQATTSSRARSCHRPHRNDPRRERPPRAKGTKLHLPHSDDRQATVPVATGRHLIDAAR